MVFEVKIHLNDSSSSEYHVVATDDFQAREKVEVMEIRSYKDFGNGKYPGIDYCEIKMICKLDDF